MGGLIVLAALFIYGSISLGVIKLVVRWAGRRGRRKVLWAETLTWREVSPRYEHPGYYTGRKLNERIASLFRKERTPLFRVWTTSEILQDIKTGELLVRRIRIYTDDDTISGQFIRYSQDMIAKKEFSNLWDRYKQLGTEIP